jgi:hypothetical protein
VAPSVSMNVTEPQASGSPIVAVNVMSVSPETAALRVADKLTEALSITLRSTGGLSLPANCVPSTNRARTLWMPVSQ